MSLRGYFNLFSILIALTNCLLLGESSRAFAEPEADSDKTDLKRVNILIDDFEQIGSESVPNLKAGPRMLSTGLLSAASRTKFVQLTVVERRSVNAILKEKGISEKLPEVFDQSTVKALRFVKADYAIMAAYSKINEEHGRIDARIVKVEEAAAPISKFHVFRLDDFDPLQELAERLIDALLEHISEGSALARTASSDRILLCFMGFKYKGPQEWEMLSKRVTERFMSLLVKSKRENLRLIDTVGKSRDDFATEYAGQDFLVFTGDITIGIITKDLLDINVFIKIVDKKDGVETCVSKSLSEPQELLRDDFLKDLEPI